MKIKHHYKSIISVLMAAALFYSAAPRADILDGGEIQFNGMVTEMFFCILFLLYFRLPIQWCVPGILRG